MRLLISDTYLETVRYICTIYPIHGEHDIFYEHSFSVEAIYKVGFGEGFVLGTSFFVFENAICTLVASEEGEGGLQFGYMALY